MARLFDTPALLPLYFRLRDETSRAQWRYGEDDHIFYRGLDCEFIESQTYLFDPSELAGSLALTRAELRAGLLRLLATGCVDGLHFGVVIDERVRARESHGIPVDDLVGPGGEYDRDSLPDLAAVHMPSVPGGFVKLPKEAGQATAPVLRLVLWLYLHAGHRNRWMTYKGRAYHLAPGELVRSLADLERELGTHRRQVARWGAYALRDGLVLGMPQGRHHLWKTRIYPRRPR